MRAKTNPLTPKFPPSKLPQIHPCSPPLSLFLSASKFSSAPKFSKTDFSSQKNLNSFLHPTLQIKRVPQKHTKKKDRRKRKTRNDYLPTNREYKQASK
jgi:hypothetical protein